MRINAISCGIILGFSAICPLRADQLDMQNGDRYFGSVVSVTFDTVIWQSEVLGRISVPRKKVAALSFGTNSTSRLVTRTAPMIAPTNRPAAAAINALMRTNAGVSASSSNLTTNSELARQVREQLLAGSPEAAAKYDEMVSAFLTGKLNLNDIRRQAKSSADQLRDLKRDLGPEAGDSLDAYLNILDAFLNESPVEPTSAASQPQP